LDFKPKKSIIKLKLKILEFNKKKKKKKKPKKGMIFQNKFAE